MNLFQLPELMSFRPLKIDNTMAKLIHGLLTFSTLSVGMYMKEYTGAESQIFFGRGPGSQGDLCLLGGGPRPIVCTFIVLHCNW